MCLNPIILFYLLRQI
ncbi:hypothetical protein BpHYR1_000709 [Brachionus plicatilis]|uniref:Uncharacterized protein n=1 Tax=Brachionus plicatilis TaxID=10195 RepID=A0A3M7QVL4_BRAPC|nr:hypothetical protein BpHYR1_000709 [Brachionus plicatilis]